MKNDRLPVRQGDVLLLPITEIPVGAKVVDNKERIVLAYGETTGHAHTLDIKLNTMYEWEGDKLIEAKKGSVLTHEDLLGGGKGDHYSIPVKEGAWKVINQVEHTPKAIVNVFD